MVRAYAPYSGYRVGAAILTLIYFVVAAPFAWFAKRADRREPLGWTPSPRVGEDTPRSQY